MSQTDYSFMIEDLFFHKFPEKSLKKILDECRHMSRLSMPLKRKISLGDVALITSLKDVWWCTRLLLAEARYDVLKSIYPTLRRISIKESVSHETKKAIDIIYQYLFVPIKPITIMELKNCIHKVSNQTMTSFDKAIVMIIRSIYELDYSYILVNAMALIDEYDKSIDSIELNKRINEVCEIFPPLIKVKQEIN